LWPVWPKYAKLKGLEQCPLQLQFAFSHSVMTPDGRLMLVKNSKAGCTTAAQRLHEVVTGTASADVHRERDKLVQGKLAWRRFQDALGDPQTLVFSVTREPLARVVSAFKDFVLVGQNPDAKRHAEPLAARGMADATSDTAKFDIFLAYIEETAAIAPERMDRHFRPQVLNLALDHITYDRLIPLESYETGIAEVLDAAGFAPSDPLEGKFNATQVRFRPSDAQVDRVRLIYGADYVALGYA